MVRYLFALTCLHLLAVRMLGEAFAAPLPSPYDAYVATRIDNPPGKTGDIFGSTVVMSKDGLTFAVGRPEFKRDDQSPFGSVFVFEKTNGYWLRVAKLQDKVTSIPPSGQGSTLAISDDGATLATGAPSDNGYEGAAYVYRRNGGIWSQMGPKLTITVQSGSPGFARAVAISADGTTLAVSGGEKEAIGVIYVENGNSWVQQGPFLFDPLDDPNDVSPNHGQAIALNARGDHVFIANLNTPSPPNMVVFQKNSSNHWNFFSRYTGVDAGKAIKVSDDATMVLLLNSWSKIEFLTLQGTNYVLQQVLDFNINPDGYIYSSDFAVFGNFTRVVMGNKESNLLVDSQGGDDRFLGMVFFVERTGLSWSLVPGNLSLLTFPDSYTFGENLYMSYGGVMAASDDGTSLIVGAYGDYSYSGAAFVYEMPRSPSLQPTPQPTSLPSQSPTRSPTHKPSADPTRQPSRQPSIVPTTKPSQIPSVPTTMQPTSDATSRPAPFQCRPAPRMNGPRCSNIIRTCCAARVPMKWAGRGCRIKGKIMGDGGCQCGGYCGYMCAGACNGDPECRWDSSQRACIVRATGLVGGPITTCT